MKKLLLKKSNKKSFFPYCIILVVLLIIVLPMQLFAQKKIQPVPFNKSSVASLSKVFKKYDLFKINTTEIKSFADSNRKGFIDLEFSFEGYPELPISIYANDILSDNYKSVYAGEAGKQFHSRPDCMTYTGSVPGEGDSKVYLTLGNNLIYGLIGRNHKQYLIEPLRYYDRNAEASVYILYEAADIVPHSGVSCGLTEARQHILPGTDRSGDNNTSSITGTCKTVEIAIASDYDMMLKYGPGDLEQRNIGVINLMPVFYDNTQLTWGWVHCKIAGQYFSTSAASNASFPAYSGQDAVIMLNDFNAWGEAGNFGFTYDVAQLWTARDIGVETPVGSGVYSFSVIGLANVGSTCTPNKYIVLEDFYNTLLMLSGVAAHELGHTLGAQHDASGSWVMSPSISNPPATTFSPASISAMSTYTSGAGGSCFSTCATEAPLAAISASAKNICVGNSITYTDVSVGTIASRSWTFTGGNISTSTSTNPTVSYLTTGLKSVKLVITGTTGLTSEVTKFFYVSAPAAAVNRTSIAGNGTTPVLHGFHLADINHYGPNNIFVGGSYTDNSCLENTRLNTGTTYTVSFDAGVFSGSQYDTKLEVFIDYNADGDFDDANEVIFLGQDCHSQGTANGTFSFTTPSTVITNQFLRLRLVAVSCALAHTNGRAIYSNSMIEDYAIYFGDPCVTNAVISGPTSSCAVAGLTPLYSITATGGVSGYYWTCPSGASVVSGQGTNAALVKFPANFQSGNVSVYLNGCDAQNAVRTLALNPLPLNPSEIQGASNVCTLTSILQTVSTEYSIPSVPGATNYQWTVPPGMTITAGGQGVNGMFVSISSSFTQGNVSVIVSNCGSSVTKTLTVSRGVFVSASAGTGGTVSPSSFSVVCPGSNPTYTITPGSCYNIANVKIDGVSQGPISSYTFTNINYSNVNQIVIDHSVSATFSIKSYQLNVSAGAGGSISPGSSTVNCGSNSTCTITPDPCYQIVDVIVDGISQGAVGTYTFTNVTAAHSISAIFVLNTYSITVTSGPNGSIIPATGTVNCGENATYTITPNACYSIANVVVDAVSQGAIGTYTFTNVTATHTISATFSLNTYAITATAAANGSITPGTGVVECGTNPVYTITPNSCYSIADVIVDGVSQGAVGTYTFTNVTTNHTITASFVLSTFTITVTAGANGSITPGTGSVNCGDNATYTITPNGGFAIADVVVDGVSQGAVGTYTFTNVTANHTISVTFVNNTIFTITASAGANGSVSPNGAAVVNSGANQSYTITPAACYHVLDILVDGISVGAVTTYTFTNVTANHTISASFAINAALTVSVSGPVNVCPYIGTGDPITYTATSAGATGFTWVIPPNVTIISGQGTASLTVTFQNGFTTQANKQLRVTALSACGNSPLFIYYLAAQTPNTPGPIVAGSSNICSVIGTAGTISYTINAVAGASSYIWNNPAGTTISHPNGTGVNDTTVTLGFSVGFTNSNITVSATSPCLTSGTRSLAITMSAPSTPGLISGPTNACPYMSPGGATATYSIAAVANATSYNWVVPAGAINLTGQGTTTITFTYPSTFISGSITVSATNGCGTSGLRSLAISKLNPATPGNIDIINTQPCPGREYTYTIANMPANTTSLQWTIPAGATITAGQGTTSITVSYSSNAINGNVTVQALNNCGSSTIKSSAVRLPVCPPGDGRPVAKGATQTAPVKNMQVNVYPNPTVNDFKLKVSTPGKEAIHIRISNMQGRELKQFTVLPYQTTNIGSDLNAGLYIMEVRQGNSVEVKKLLKF